ncbi:DUF938 domain-containing protein [Chachezhania sediminis]|uniref:DUF938 domain-containing protein n=1 Tax=Chachezhania sediminis TaxID=2599291 RepID=UPI00131C1E65|nr:DUF938 domain-containing protein [Chachezhania sediminis]
MPIRDYPAYIASAAEDAGGDKLFAPSAERNAGPIGDLLVRIAPHRGRALELAAGTGQHSVAFAARLPGLLWQPTEVQPDRIRSVNARIAEAGIPNIAPALSLDALSPGWGATQAPRDFIMVANLLHLVSTFEVETLVTEAAQALAPGGRFLIYGPFMRSGVLTSDGDRSFHATLQTRDPETGYKDDLQIADWLAASGLALLETVEMPANNLAFVTERPALEIGI